MNNQKKSRIILKYLNKTYPKVPIPLKYRNKFTSRAKQKLLESSYPVCRDIGEKIAVAQDNNSLLELFIKKQDKLRNLDIKDYFNLFRK